MSKFRKMTAVLMSVIMIVSCFCINAGAAGIASTAKSASSGKSYSATISKYGATADYKITASKKRDLILEVDASIGEFEVTVYDSKGNTVKASSKNTKTGNASIGSKYVTCSWNEAFETYSGTLTYQVSKGTYYIRFKTTESDGSGKLSFTPTLAPQTSTTTSSNDKPTVYLSINLYVGQSIRFYTYYSSGSYYYLNDKITSWSSTNSSAVYVDSKGLVYARKKGQAVICAETRSAKCYLIVNSTPANGALPTT